MEVVQGVDVSGGFQLVRCSAEVHEGVAVGIHVVRQLDDGPHAVAGGHEEQAQVEDVRDVAQLRQVTAHACV